MAVYTQQSIFWTQVDYLWSERLRELGLIKQITPVIAVACNAEQLHGLSFAKPSKIGFFRIAAAFFGIGWRRRQNPTQNLVAAASLKGSVHSFVVQIALQQHVPLRTRVENP